MIVFSDEELMRYVREDVPYGDATTHLQGAYHAKARLMIYTREPIVVSGIDEAKRIATLLGAQVRFAVSARSHAKAEQTLLEIEGPYEALHQIWRSAQNLLEFGCKIATVTHDMVAAIRAVNPVCELLTTRKSFPFAKRFCMQSVLAGGGLPHRLGLSETILLFPQHRALYANEKEFFVAIKAMQARAPEKRVAVETRDYEEACVLLENGVDLLQVDKATPETLARITAYKQSHAPHARIVAAGGITPSNVQTYAKTGVDGIVTSYVYSCGMANLGSVVEVV
jgi:molybdenum transport protein